jgi:hypothetical protein
MIAALPLDVRKGCAFPRVLVYEMRLRLLSLES